MLITISAFSLKAQQDVALIKSYIEKYKDIAIQEMKRTGIPASITLAQGIHESGIGNSYLAKNTNNHFGIKCHEKWTGKTFRYTDDAPNECFRVYDKVEDSYIDHSEFLKNRPRYAGLFQLDINDYKAWAYGLKKAGYATNPKYPEILIKTIEDNELYKYDNANEELATDEEGIEKDIQSEIEEIDIFKENADKKKTDRDAIDKTIKQPLLHTAKSSKKISLINKRKAVKVTKNETLDILSNKLQIDKNDLLAYNDLVDASKIKEGQYLFIQKKRKKNKEKKYTVRTTDNMWLIAQKKGVQLAVLLKRNKLTTGEEPAVKETIYLKGKAKQKPKLRLAQPTIKPSKPASTPLNIPQTKSNTTTKNNAVENTIIRANDTVYPPIQEPQTSVIAENKVLGFESDRKLLENNIQTNKDSILPKPKNVTISQSTSNATTETSAIQNTSVSEAKTVYPEKINYTELPKSSNGKHVVIKGDTLYNICKRYGITLQQLTEWNQLTDQTARLGQILKIQP